MLFGHTTNFCGKPGPQQYISFQKNTKNWRYPSRAIELPGLRIFSAADQYFFCFVDFFCSGQGFFACLVFSMHPKVFFCAAVGFFLLPQHFLRLDKIIFFLCINNIFGKMQGIFSIAQVLFSSQLVFFLRQKIFSAAEQYFYRGSQSIRHKKSKDTKVSKQPHTKHSETKRASKTLSNQPTTTNQPRYESTNK